MLSLDGSYLNNVYTRSDSDLRYPVKSIDGTNTNISLDTLNIEYNQMEPIFIFNDLIMMEL